MPMALMAQQRPVQSRAHVLNHPIHPMLIPLPIGLWIFSLVADVVYRAGGGPLWVDIAYWTMIGGTVGALLAAVPGLIDYFALTDRDAGRIATIHMVLNLTIVALYAVNLIVRSTADVPGGGLPFLLSLIAVALLLVSGWFGWELVYGKGVAVSPEIEVRVREAVRRGAA
jgi:uncharacterized membrane protein